MTTYFWIGLGFYMGLAVTNPRSFADASLAGMIRGILLGFVAWPIGIVVQLVLALKDEP